jgi:endonuclease YncB( thermonuclease family)
MTRPPPSLAAAAMLLVLTAPASGQWREPPRSLNGAPQTYTGCRAVDGDTLACREGRVRLRGVDTPERGQNGYRAAQGELGRRMGGSTVTVMPHHRDRHGRVVGDVYSRGRNLGREMDADGWSKPNGARR